MPIIIHTAPPTSRSKKFFLPDFANQGATSFLDQDDDEAGEDLQNLGHDHSGRGKEAVSRQRPYVTDAEDERGILDHQNGQTDVLQLSVSCRG